MTHAPHSNRMKSHFASLGLIATVLVTFIFADVIFFHSSFQPSNINPLIGRPASWSMHSIFPQLNPRTTPVTGYADLGATAWQGEPARYLMARDFNAHESPYWNPYSASGTVGPETLVDIKFSPWTVLSAYFFHASPESFDYGLILIFALGTFCTLCVLHQYLQLSVLASTAGALVYLLNGFATANFNSQNGQSYFFAPLLLLALSGFSQRQTLRRWLIVVLADAMMLTITMVPTLLLVLVTTHALSLAMFTASPNSNDKPVSLKQWACWLSLLLLAGLVALLLTGFLWLPVLDSFFSTDMLTKYQQRSIQPTHQMESLLSVFTPKHFWQTRSQILHASLYPQANLEKDESLIAYIGIFPAILASLAIAKNARNTKKIVWISLLLLIFSYARIFGWVGLIDSIPVIKNISIQYFGCMSALALMVLVAFGTENVYRNNLNILPALLTLALILISFLLLYFKLGFVDIPPYHQYLKIILFQLSIASLTLFFLTRSEANFRGLATILMALMLVELVFYMNTVRPIRYDPVEKQPEFVHFLESSLGDARVMNIGFSQSLYPEYGTMYGIKQIDTENPAQLPWYRDFYVRHFGSDSWLFLTLGEDAGKGVHVQRTDDNMDCALDIANVKYILVVNNAKNYLDYFQQHHYPIVFNQEKLTIFENTHRLSTATLVPALLSSDVIPETNDFNPSLQASTQDKTLLEEARQLGIPVLDHPDPHLTGLSGTTRVVKYHNTEIVIDTDSTQAAVLVLSEVWHPGWKATVDAHPVIIGRINEAFRGIALSAGQHQVRVYYDPAAVRYGWRISLGTAFLLLLLLLRHLWLPLRLDLA